MRTRTPAFVAAASLAFASAACADILISNFSAALGTGTVFGTGSTTVYKAAGFTMPGQDYTLDRVVLSLNMGGGGTPIVSIWSGASAPTTRVATLDNPPLAGQADFSFTPSAAVVLTAGETYWVYVESVTPPTASFLWDATSPSTVPTGLAAFTQYIFNGSASTFRNRLEVHATPGGAPPCYANCDGSTTAPILNVSDFICFQTRYAANDTYANCDGSTTPPILNVSDFICFQTAYSAGCS